MDECICCAHTGVQRRKLREALNTETSQAEVGLTARRFAKFCGFLRGGIEHEVNDGSCICICICIYASPTPRHNQPTGSTRSKWFSQNFTIGFNVVAIHSCIHVFIYWDFTTECCCHAMPWYMIWRIYYSWKMVGRHSTLISSASASDLHVWSNEWMLVLVLVLVLVLCCVSEEFVVVIATVVSFIFWDVMSVECALAFMEKRNKYFSACEFVSLWVCECVVAVKVMKKKERNTEIPAAASSKCIHS